MIVNTYKRKEINYNEYANLSQCYFFLDQHEPVANLLFSLIKSNKQDSILLAYQISQDLSENENIVFLYKIKLLYKNWIYIFF